MHTGHRYRLGQTLMWSRNNMLWPAAWAAVPTAAYVALDWHFIALPWLPMSLVGVAVAFYLGFKNNASYDRLWEARKIWGAIVNASRSFAFTARDVVRPQPGGAPIDEAELAALHEELVMRHVAWMDALRFQLRKLKTWEHEGGIYDRAREGLRVPEYTEVLTEQLARSLDDDEVAQVTAQINPAAHLLANQSARIAALRDRGLLDGFGQLMLQNHLVELMAQQGKAERIKNFPFPRQYATVNSFFAVLFALLVPFGMLDEFHQLGQGFVWLTIPFSALVSWVFLTTDMIGEWSENPFEGLSNDVPISQMSRGIERDIRQMVGHTDLPPGREPKGMILM